MSHSGTCLVPEGMSSDLHNSCKKQNGQKTDAGVGNCNFSTGEGKIRDSLAQEAP